MLNHTTHAEISDSLKNYHPRWGADHDSHQTSFFIPFIEANQSLCGLGMDTNEMFGL